MKIITSAYKFAEKSHKEKNPKIKKEYAYALIPVLFFSGYFLYASGFSCHPETLVVFFSLIGLDLLFKRRYFVSSLLFGLAFSSKQVAIFIILPVIFYILRTNVHLRVLFSFMGGVICTFLLIMLPFVIKNPYDTYYGILGFSKTIFIEGPNIWWLTQAIIVKILGFEQMKDLLTENANYILFGNIVLFLYLFFSLKKTKITITDLFNIIVLLFFTYNIFSKRTSGFHQYLPAFVFFLIWDAIRSKQSFPLAGFMYTLFLFSAQFLQTPLWQLLVLIVHIFFFIYMLQVQLKIFNPPSRKSPTAGSGLESERRK